jgi:hypothetical protein
VKALKKATPRGLLVGSPKVTAALQRLDLVDEYRFVVHPVVAGPRSVPVFRPAAIIGPEVRGRDTAQIGHRGVALSPALAALSTSETQFGLASRQTFAPHQRLVVLFDHVVGSGD